MSEIVKPYRSSRTRDPGSSRASQLAAKRESIVAAAIRQFAEHGYEGARVDAIAAEVGIAKGSVFAHFESKARLFVAAYRAAARALPRWQRRTWRGPRGRVLRHGSLLARPDRAPRPGRLDRLPRHADRQPRDRPRDQARRRALPGRRGSVRHAGVRPLGHRAGRGPRRPVARPRDRRPGLARRAVPGRAGHRRARPGPVPAGIRCRPGPAGRRVRGAAAERDRDR